MARTLWAVRFPIRVPNLHTRAVRSPVQRVALLLLAGCGPSGSSPPEAAAPAAVMGAIVGANVVWGDALVRGDGAALTGAYAANAVYMTGEGDVTGPAAIRDWLLGRRTALSDSIHSTRVQIDQLDVAGDRAYEAGTLTYTLISRQAADIRRELTVRYVNFWQRAADGRWLLARSLRPLP